MFLIVCPLYSLPLLYFAKTNLPCFSGTFQACIFLPFKTNLTCLSVCLLLFKTKLRRTQNSSHRRQGGLWTDLYSSKWTDLTCCGWDALKMNRFNISWRKSTNRCSLKSVLKRKIFKIVSPKRFDLEGEAGFLAGEEKLAFTQFCEIAFSLFAGVHLLYYKTTMTMMMIGDKMQVKVGNFFYIARKSWVHLLANVGKCAIKLSQVGFNKVGKKLFIIFEHTSFLRLKWQAKYSPDCLKLWLL